MIIYQGADNYFMYVMIMELRSSDNNHCVASAYGLFPDGNSYRYMTIPIHFINNKFNRMVLFQGQMKFYKDEKHNLPERNLYVGKVTKIKQFKNGVACLHMPINEKETKWMSLMVYDDVISKEQLQRMQPIRLPDGTNQYQPAVILAGEEKMYHDYPQSRILRCYN